MQGRPKGRISKVMYPFTKTKTGTKLIFGHTKVPTSAYKGINKGINAGWKSSYWNKMKAVLAGKKPKHRAM